MGELGSCGVVGHGGAGLDSPFAKIDAVELRGSNIVNAANASILRVSMLN